MTDAPVRARSPPTHSNQSWKSTIQNHHRSKNDRALSISPRPAARAIQR
jgi:hypothetical protein